MHGADPTDQSFLPSLGAPPALRRPSGRSAPPPAHQIDVGSRLEERIGRGFDAVHSQDWIENDVLLLAGFVRDDLAQTDFAERALRTFLGPGSRGGSPNTGHTNTNP